MTTNYQSQHDDLKNIYQQIYELVKTQPRAWQSVAALIGLLGAVFCPFVGTVLGTVTWFIVSPRAISVLHVVSIVAFALTVPLLLWGAHCLDLIEKKVSLRSARKRQPSNKPTSLNVSAQGGR